MAIQAVRREELIPLLEKGMGAPEPEQVVAPAPGLTQEALEAYRTACSTPIFDHENYTALPEWRFNINFFINTIVVCIKNIGIFWRNSLLVDYAIDVAALRGRVCDLCIGVGSSKWAVGGWRLLDKIIEGGATLLGALTAAACWYATTVVFLELSPLWLPLYTIHKIRTAGLHAPVLPAPPVQQAAVQEDKPN